MTEGQHDQNGDTYHRRPADNGTMVKRFVANKVDHTYSKAILWLAGTIVIPLGLWWVQDTLKENRKLGLEIVQSIQEIATEVKVTVSQQEEIKDDIDQHDSVDVNIHKAQWGQISNNQKGIANLRDRTGRLEGINVRGE